MASRPKVVAFDIIETVFSLESMRPRLTSLGLSSGRSTSRAIVRNGMTQLAGNDR
jgi:hypothetical protein